MKKILLLMLFLAGNLFAVGSKPTINLPSIHEAYIQRITDPVPQLVIPKQPPASLNEKQPPQPNPQSIWISGYWEWIREKNDFNWICGLWRLPPPDLIWSVGYWKDVKGGWTWVRGAWMPSDTSTWVYSQNPPSSPLNEETGDAPGKDYFWASGYWNYEVPQGFFSKFMTGEFKWLSGSWQKFDPNWIFEFAHWIWRPEGYLLVPAYWDWTLDVRGLIYDCKTEKEVEPKTILQQLTPCYPYYSCECCHSWYYQPEIWEGCDCIPEWWNWQDWWSFPYDDQWWLWWWWLHDDYPEPPFIDVDDLIDLIPPPPIVIIDIFDYPPPIFITPFGVPTIENWIDVINTVLGGGPFIPLDKTITITDTFQNTFPKTPKKNRPKGKPGKEHPPKKPTHPGKKHPPSSGKGKIPHKPTNPKPKKPSKPEHPKEHPPKTTKTHEPTPAPVAPVPPHPQNTPPPPPTPTYTPPTYFPPSQPVYNPPEYYPPEGFGGYDGGYDGGYGGGYDGGYYGSYGGYYGGGGYGGGYDGHGYHGGGGYHGGYGHGGGGYGGGHGGGGYGGGHGGGGYGGGHGGGYGGGHGGGGRGGGGGHHR